MNTIVAELGQSEITKNLREILERQRASFLQDMPVPLEVRRDRIERGLAMVLTHRENFIRALMQDFPTRSEEWTLIAEIFSTVNVYTGAIKSLHKWMRPERRKAPPPFNLFGARAEIQYQPLGVVGVMGAWNAPLNLVLVPLATVLAAGNRAMLCPSDMMTASAAALDVAVKEYFDPTEVAVIMGGLETSKAFSALPFDHLLFTGSPGVGAQVMSAAAPNMVPVTLELGGKCPVVILPDADLDDAAHRLIGAKTLNGGQACLAPDHFFVPRDQLDAVVKALDGAMTALYPDSIANPAYCGLAIDRHFNRLVDVVAEARARGTRVEVIGKNGKDSDSDIDQNKRRLALHVVIDPPTDTRASTEELFGPVIVISTYDNLDDACARIRSAPKPLALYVFSKNDSQRQYVLDRTFSGGVTLNDAMMHYSVPDLPFGGVGRSGIGAYSFGIEGFKRFSHARSVYTQAGPRALLRVLQPPYGKMFEWAIKGQLEKLSKRYANKQKH